jgi:VWFA-related protein
VVENPDKKASILFTFSVSFARVMVASRRLICHIFSHLLLSLVIVSPVALAQTPEPREQKPDDVVRVFTELVQTDVMVFDKQGHFINGLTKDNFELKIDGQVRPIQFFRTDQCRHPERRGPTCRSARFKKCRHPKSRCTAGPWAHDLLLCGRFSSRRQAFVSTRKLISDFIDKDMGQNDQAAIASATGQIGFLQQLTENRTVLHSAVNRLNVKLYSVTDSDRPQMSEYEAMLIDNNDREVENFFVSETLRLNPGLSREMAASMVHNRASSMLSQSAVFSANTLSGLERLVRVAKDLPGRKILFFLSNGFLLQNRRGDADTRLRRIISAAAKSGVVIYSIDTQGLTVPKSDMSGDAPFDPYGLLARSTHGEHFELQDGLHALAHDTGGRMIINTNDFRPGLKSAISETAVYYLLAWKPDPDNKKPGRFRNIQVNVVGRPELVVRVRKGFFDIEPTPTVAESKNPATPEEDNKLVATKLRQAITAAYPQLAIPLTLGLNYYESPDKGPTLAASVQIPGEFLKFGPRNGKLQAVSDVTGVLFDEKGVAKGTFYERLTTTAPTPEIAKDYHGDITYTYPANVQPGLYQVRVAVRDDSSGLTGSVHGWIEIPDLSKKQLSMSSLLLGERKQNTMKSVSSGGEAGSVLLNPSHRFDIESTLRFLAFAYNATLSQTDQQPDLAVQVQVIRDDQPVITTALRKLDTEGLPDVRRIPYAAEIPLSGLQAGRYVLQLTFIDRVSKQSTSRQTHFDIN